jgi:hypothetical protein
MLPEVYVMQSVALPDFIYTSPKGRRVVPLSRVRRKGENYLNDWELVL